MSSRSRSVCVTQPPVCDAPVFSNARRNITVSYNLCSNQDVLAWSYKVEGASDNQTALYFAAEAEEGETGLAGVENLAVTSSLNPSSCLPCSCDSVLFFPEVNLCSKVTVVLLSQKHTNLLGAPQSDSTAVPGTTNCYNNLSERATYKVWKAVLCSPVQCAQKVEFSLVGELLTASLTSVVSSQYVLDNTRVENILLKNLQ